MAESSATNSVEPDPLAAQISSVSGSAPSVSEASVLAANASQETTPYTPASATSEGSHALPKVPGYEMIRVLGRGGMGIVYLALQPSLKRHVALKMVLSAEAGSAERSRFFSEAEAVARLRHANIVQIHEIGEHEGRPYFTLEYVEGGSLARHLGGEPQPARLSAELVETLARAVHYAHSQGVVHRDLKPANILRLLDGTPKVTDFGLAKQLDDASGQTQSGAVMGTPSYMAPEQASGQARGAGPAVDVWALGAILYELLTGRPPFKGAAVLETLRQVLEEDPAPPSHVQPNVPRDLETICLKCLHKAPQRRYGSALELADDLRRFLAGEPIRARPISLAHRIVKWSWRHPAAASLLAAVALSLIAIAGVWMRFTVELRAEGLRTKEALAKTQRIAAELGIDRSLNICARGDANQGLLWLARDLQDLPENCADLDRLIRLNLDAWQHTFSPLVAMFPHESSVVAVSFSPDGKLFATASWDHTAALWDVASGERRAELRHGGWVNALAFSADGSLLLTGSEDGTARLWSTADGAERAVLRHGGPVRTVAFHPRETLALTGGADGIAQLWRGDGVKEGAAIVHKGGVGAVAFRSDGMQFATGGADKIVRTWITRTGKPVAQTPPHQGAVTRLAYSPFGDLLASLESAATGSPRLWDADTLATRPAILGKAGMINKNTAHDVAWSPDGNVLATANQSWDGYLYTPKKPAAPVVFQIHQAKVNAVAFSPDGETFVSVSEDGTAMPRNYQGKPVAPALVHQGPVLAVAFNRDGTLIGTGSWDRVGRLWRSLDAARAVHRVQRVKLGMAWNHFLYTHDGKHIFTAGNDGHVQRWDAATGESIGPAFIHNVPTWRLALHPDGKVLAVALTNGEVQLWDLDKNAPRGPRFRPPDEGDVPRHLVFSSDGGTIALSSHGAVFHGPWAQGGPFQKITYPTWVMDLALSPDGKTLLAGGSDQCARLFDLATGEERGEPLRHQGGVAAVAFTPDGRFLVTGSDDKTARLWDASTGLPVGLPMQHQGAVGEVCFSHDSRTLATSGREGHVYLWDVATSKAIGPLWPLHEFAGSVAFSPDGKSISVLASNVRVMPTPTARQGSPIELVGWAQIRSGLEMSSDGRIQPLDAPTWRARRKELQIGMP